MGVKLGQTLRSLRSGRTAESVAAGSGIGIDTLRKIERGAVASPGFFLVASVADELGASLDDIAVSVRTLAGRDVEEA